MTETAAAPDFEEIAENFAFLDDWEDRYGYVIELGKEMPPLPDSLKGPETKVDGCASQVWIVPRVEEGPPRRLHFDGDSDAMIVRGLIAILRALYSGRTVEEIRAIDPEAELDRLKLRDHLSSQRSNGLKAMVARLQALAAAA